MSEQLSEEIQQKCFELCSQYVWLNVTRNQVLFEPIVGGITNQMIKCSRMESTDGKPTEIAVKLYRKGDRPLDSNDSVFNDFIIGLIVSSEDLGPKIFGVADEAVLMEYINCRHFSNSDLKNTLIIEELGRKLAKVHSLRPPIKRNAHWITETFTETNVTSYKKCPNSELIRQNQLKYFIENDFQTEFRLLLIVLEECQSPIVFSHNDFGFNNILVRNQTQSHGLEERIVLSDFEFSSYGFRGRDFGLVFDDWLNFHQMSYDMNCHSIIEPFLKSYLCESIRIMGQKYANEPNNSLQHLVFESKVFLLLQKLFSVLFYLNADQTIFKQLTKTQILRKANELFGNYLCLKQRLIEENVFKC